MIKEIIVDPKEVVSTNIVDQLSEIDLTKDIMIVSQYTRHQGMFIKHVEFDVDGFSIISNEPIKATSSLNNSDFKIFSRMRMSLPFGVFPQFESQVRGLTLRDIDIEKLQGVNIDKVMRFGDMEIPIKAVGGLYSIYNKFHMTLRHYDRALFISNEYRGLEIPPRKKTVLFRILPHYAGKFPEIRDVYIICSSYLYDRFPNM